MVEIKGVKTSHFMERKTAPLACSDAGLKGHVERTRLVNPIWRVELDLRRVEGARE
jgi:hypothetical protein